MAVCGRGDLGQMVSLKSPIHFLHFQSKATRFTRCLSANFQFASNIPECSVKSSEGFRLHKAVVRFVYNVPTVTECERMCFAESKFRCVTYSYRYSPLTRDNCLLCDRPLGHLDYYSDIEPDRDYDIYAMADDPQMCQAPPAIIEPHGRQGANAREFSNSFFYRLENFN